jgi:anti-sigma factor RsiW
MNTCSYGSIVDAYHDGELSPEARTAFEQHLVSCPPCQADLAQTRQLAALITSAPKRMLSSTARQALFDLAPMIGERVYLRMAEWTTALAASVLIAASCWLVFGAKPVTSVADNNAANTGSFMPVFLNPPKEHDAADVPDDPKLVDWVTTNVAVAQNP